MNEFIDAEVRFSIEDFEAQNEKSSLKTKTSSPMNGKGLERNAMKTITFDVVS